MTEQVPSQTESDEQIDDDGHSDAPGEAADILLLGLVMMVEGMDAGGDEPSSMSLTVSVPGAIVSGLLVPRRWWALQSVARFKAANEDVGSAIGSVFEEFKPEEGKAPNYLHMMDARFIHGGPLSNDGMIWRTPIAAVTGWTFTQARP